MLGPVLLTEIAARREVTGLALEGLCFNNYCAVSAQLILDM